MAELKFDVTLDNSNFLKKTEEIQKGIRDAAKLIEKESKQIDVASQKFQSFDLDVQKMCGNLNKYFDGLLDKVELLTSLLQAGKIELSAPSVESGGASAQQLDELRTRNAELTAELQKQRQEIMQQQAEWNKLAAVIESGNVAAIEEYRQSAISSADTFSALKTGLQGVEGAAGLVVGVMELFNKKSEEMEQIQAKVQSLLEITVGLENTLNMVKKSGIVMRTIENVQAKASVAALALETKVKGGNIVLTWAAVAAQKALNLVAKANPYVLLATAIMSVIGGIWMLVKANKENTAEQENINRKAKDAQEIQENYVKSISSTAASQIAQYRKMQFEWNKLGGSLKQQKKYINDNQDEFHNLGVAINSVNDASNFLVRDSKKFVQSLMERARAAAHYKQVESDQEKLIALDEQDSSYTKRVYKKGDTFEKKIKGSILGFIDDESTVDILLDTDEKVAKAQAVEDKRAFEEHKKNKARNKAKKDELNKRIERNLQLSSDSTILADSLLGESRTSEDFNQNKNEKSQFKQDNLNDQIIKNEQSLNDERLAIMADGRRKRLLQSQQEWEEKKASLKKEYDDLVAENNKYGITTPKEVTDTYTDRLAVNDEAKKNRDAGINKEYDQQEIDFQKELTSVYLTEEEKRKQTIKDRYDEMRRSQKEAYDNEIKSIDNTKKGEEAWNETTQALFKYLGILGKIDAAQAFEEKKDKEVNFDYKKIETFGKLFSDVKNSSVKDLRTIADEASKTLDFVEEGKWDDAKGLELGIKKEEFDILQKSPEKIEDIRNGIKNVNQEAGNMDNAFGKIGHGFSELFKAGSDTDEFKAALAEIEQGLNEVMQAGKFLSDSLSSLGDAFGNDALKGVAEGINVAMDAANSAMQGASAGLAVGGPIGAAAGAAIGLVSSLASSIAKIHDGKLQKKIEESERAVKKLGWAYSDLERGMDKATSGADKDSYSQKMVENLKQQQEELKKQQAAEGKKKKGDKEKIEDLGREYEELNQKIQDIEEERFNQRLQESIEASERAVKNLEWAFSDLKRAMDKTLGESKYDYIPKLLANIKAQQDEVQRQINEESRKTNPDKSKLDDLTRKWAELDQQMEDTIENLKNEILGGSVKDIAQKLGDALIEAFVKGEDAAKTWEKSVKEIIGDIVKRMLITKFFEKPIGDLFNDFFDKIDPSKGDSDNGNRSSRSGNERSSSSNVDNREGRPSGNNRPSNAPPAPQTSSASNNASPAPKSAPSSTQNNKNETTASDQQFSNGLKGNGNKSTVRLDEYKPIDLDWGHPGIPINPPMPKQPNFADIEEDKPKEEETKPATPYDELYDGLMDIFDGMGANMEPFKELIDKFLGGDGKIEDGVSGQVQSAMTEGTGSQLVGLWNMTAMDVRVLKDLSQKHLDEFKLCRNDVNSILTQTMYIQTNTYRTADNTDGLVPVLRSLRTELEEIKRNTKTYNGRG